MKKKIIVMLAFIVLLIVVAYSLNEVSKSRSFQLFGELIVSIPTDEKVVSLTFDDGPAENAQEILEILSEENVKATFYFTGYEIENNLEIAAKFVKDGHEIGNHSYSHPRMVFKTPSTVKTELQSTDELIRQIGYQGEIHFRPPFGKRLVILPYYLSQNNQKTILWNLEPETHPEIAADSQKIVDYVVDNITPGSIILLHVMYESRRESLNSVRGIINSLRDQGYEFVTVSELLQYNQ